MPQGFTPNLGLTLPSIGGDTNQWGKEVNANFSTLDGAIASKQLVPPVLIDESTAVIDPGVATLTIKPLTSSVGFENAIEVKAQAPQTGVAFSVDPQGNLATQGEMAPGIFTFATLPGGPNGAIAWCSNGRKVGEGAGSGTGVPVYRFSGAWRVFSTDALVTI
jgi:hypothetical protein